MTDEAISALPEITSPVATDYLTLLRTGDPAGTKNKKITIENALPGTNTTKHEFIEIENDGDTEFILKNAPVNPDRTIFMLNGIQQPYGVNLAFSINDTTLTWNDYLGVTLKKPVSPGDPDVIEVWYDLVLTAGHLEQSHVYYVADAGSDANDGKSKESPFLNDQPAIDDILTLVPSPTNRFEIRHIGAMTRDIGSKVLPDYTNYIWESGQITGLITAGEESYIEFDRFLVPNLSSGIIADGKTFSAKGNYLGPVPTTGTGSKGIALDNEAILKIDCKDYDFGLTDCQVYNIDNASILYLSGNRYKEYQLSTKPGGSKAFISIDDFGANSDTVMFNEVGSVIIDSSTGSVILNSSTFGEVFRNVQKYHKLTNIPLFSAHLSANAVDATGDGIAFWDFIANVVDFDIGSNYSNITGIFTAPVAGKYQPFCNTRMTKLAASHTDLQIKFVSTQASFNVCECNPGAIRRTPSNFLTISATVPPVWLDFNDTYKFQVLVSGGAKVVDIGGILSRIGCTLITAD